MWRKRTFSGDEGLWQESCSQWGEDHLFLISSASVRSCTMPIFALNVHLISPIFLKSFPVFPILLFSSISVNLISEVKSLSWVQLFETSWTETYQTYHETYQASLSTGFSRQEYWRGLPFPSPGDHPNSGIEAGSQALQADALTSEP